MSATLYRWTITNRRRPGRSGRCRPGTARGQRRRRPPPTRTPTAHRRRWAALVHL